MRALCAARVLGPPVARAVVLIAALVVVSGCTIVQTAEEALRRLGDPDAGVAISLPPASRPELQAGDTFIYQGGRVRRVGSVSEVMVLWTDLDRDLYRTGPHFFVPPLYQRYGDRVVTRTLIGDPSALWPLTPGRRAEFTVDSVTVHDDGTRKTAARRYWRCRVPGSRQVATPAGAFPAHRVECESYRSRAGSPVVRIRWDFSPQIGHFVVRDWHNLRTGGRNVYALEAALPAELATTQRVKTVLARLKDSR